METELNTLVGEWSIGGNHPQMGELEGLGRVTFEWMTGEKWLIQRWESGIAEFPSGIAVIGPADDPSGAYRQNYFDSRGVERVYDMTLSGGIWTLERRDDDFWQRFRAEVGDDRIAGRIDIAQPGEEFELDFHINYTRVS